MPRTTKSKAQPPPSGKILVERVQTGVRLEKRLLKVLKGLAEYHDMTLGDLQIDDLAQFRGGQRVEDDHVVEPVEELGLER